MTAVDPIRLRWGFTAAALATLIVMAEAASPVFWRVSTQAEFLLGDVENVSVDVTGQLLLGPDTNEVFDTTAPFLWSGSEAAGSLWVGSGNDGRVYLVTGDGTGREVFDAEELNVHAIAATADGAAYLGTSPDGAMHRVDEAGNSRVMFDPDEPYIWALASRSADEGDVYVATGDPGRIYRVSPDGSATLFYDAKATHVLALAFDTDGNVIAATGSPGQVVRISPDGRGFVVLDSPFSEVRALRVTPGNEVYAVAVTQSASRDASTTTTTQPTPTGTVSVSTSTTVTAVVTAGPSASASQTAAASPSSPSPSAAGAVYRIMPDGVWDIVWESSVDAPYDVAFSVSESWDTDDPRARPLLIATGGSGKIFRVTDQPRRVVLLTQAPAQQITRFVTTPSGAQYYLTANPGKVYRLETRRATSGSYVSDVRDAETVATWGTVRWTADTPAGTAVQLVTRTGNTEAPNDTWSAWSDPYLDENGSQISSPKARYIQWKAELNGVDATPTLHSVTTAYLPRNVRPQITALTVHDPGVVFQQPFSGTDPPIAGLTDAAEARASNANGNGEPQQSSLGRRVFRKGLQTFVWTAQDQNQDELLFDVSYRSESADEWRTLATDLRESIFTWDTTGAPDGTYVLRVVATDALSNPPGRATAGSIESTPFDIDNSPPRIELETAETPSGESVVAFVVNDTHSPVQRVEYSLDSERWHVVYPADGIPDSRVEQFEITINANERERLVIRATDALGNTVTASGP